MNGADYVVTEKSPIYEKQPDGTQIVVADRGETCERVRPSSLPWLLEQGYIVELTPIVEPVAEADDDDDALWDGTVADGIGEDE